MWAVWHRASSSNLPDILRINHADGPPRVVTAELFQGMKVCSALQTRGASGIFRVPNPCYTRLPAKSRVPLCGGVMGGCCSLEEIIQRWICWATPVLCVVQKPGSAGEPVIISRGRFWPSLWETERDRELEMEREASVPCWLKAPEGLGVCQKITGNEIWATVNGLNAFREGKGKVP